MSVAPISRNQRRQRIDTWLRQNAERLASEDANVIAADLQTLGLFSPRTGRGDIRQSLRLRCQKLRLKFKGHPRP